MAGAQWLLPITGTPLRKLVDDQFRREKVLAPSATVEHGSFGKIQYLIAGTHLVGLLPMSMADAARQRRVLRIIGPSLTEFGPISLVRCKAVEAPRVVTLFTSIVREEIDQWSLRRREAKRH